MDKYRAVGECGVLNDRSNDAHPLQPIPPVEQGRLMRTQQLVVGYATAIDISSTFLPLYLYCELTITLSSSYGSCINSHE